MGGGYYSIKKLDAVGAIKQSSSQPLWAGKNRQKKAV